jgi:hypothetical protein
VWEALRAWRGIRPQSITEEASLRGNHVIGGRFVTDVAGLVRIVGWQGNPRAGVLLAAIDGDLEIAILDEEDFFPGMAVDGVAFHSWIEGGA